MNLSEGDFRAHVETMIEERNFAQLEMWIDHGLSIYTNKEQLNTVWEQDYEDKVSEMRS